MTLPGADVTKAGIMGEEALRSNVGFPGYSAIVPLGLDVLKKGVEDVAENDKLLTVFPLPLTKNGGEVLQSDPTEGVSWVGEEVGDVSSPLV